MQGKDAQFQTLSSDAHFAQSPQTEEQGASVVEIVGYQTAVGIETGTVATVLDGQQLVTLFGGTLGHLDAIDGSMGEVAVCGRFSHFLNTDADGALSLGAG